MKFMDALATGMPMRRMMWTKHPPVQEKEAQTRRYVEAYFWLFYSGAADQRSPWIIIGTGDRSAIQRDDMLADDWEVMGSDETIELRREVEAMKQQLALRLTGIEVLDTIQKELRSGVAELSNIALRACSELEDTGGEFAMKAARELREELRAAVRPKS